MNKKAQIGKVISFVPTLIIVIVIMAIFIVLSTTISLKNGFKLDTPQALSTLPKNNLLLQEIPVTIDDKETTMLVYDAYYFFLEDHVETRFTNRRVGSSLQNEVEDILNEENDCYILDLPPAFTLSGSRYFSQDDIRSLGSNTKNALAPLLTTNTYSINKVEYHVKHYLGPCPK